MIELTESVLMQNSDDVFAKLTQLEKQGVRIAIDDFGTGYSSLSYLHRFPIDILKIDRSFVEELGKVDAGAGLARSIITLGETLGLEVVAEGIELEHQQLELIELGCVAGQGYYYSKPALLPELEYSIHMMRRRTMADTLPQGARSRPPAASSSATCAPAIWALRRAGLSVSTRCQKTSKNLHAILA